MNSPNERQMPFLFSNNFFKKKPERRKLQSKVGFEKRPIDIIAKYLTQYFGTIWFLWSFLTFIALWFLIKKSPPSDPLAIGIQIFEICLSIIVLISQNREADVDEIRQQIDLEVNVRAEKEITKILHMLEEVHKELGIAKKDLELEQMKENTNLDEIKAEVEKVIEDEKKMPSKETQEREENIKKVAEQK